MEKIIKNCRAEEGKMIFSDVFTEEEYNNALANVPPNIRNGNAVWNEKTHEVIIPVRYKKCLGAIGEEAL